MYGVPRQGTNQKGTGVTYGFAQCTDIELVGIGALPGPMRKLLGISEPLVDPANFVGKTVGLQDSALATDTLTALGATPRRFHHPPTSTVPSSNSPRLSATITTRRRTTSRPT